MLSVLTLTIYFYFFLYRRLRETEASEPPPASETARWVRYAVTAGLVVQSLAALAWMQPLAELLASSAGPDVVLDSLLSGASLEAASATPLAVALTWAGWLLFWLPLLVGLRSIVEAVGGRATWAWIGIGLIVARTLLGLAGALGWGDFATTHGFLDSTLFFLLVGCSAGALGEVEAEGRVPRASVSA